MLGFDPPPTPTFQNRALVRPDTPNREPYFRLHPPSVYGYTTGDRGSCARRRHQVQRCPR